MNNQRFEPVAIRRKRHINLLDQLGRFETTFGFPTDQLPGRVADGSVAESLDVLRWLSLKAIRDKLGLRQT